MKSDIGECVYVLHHKAWGRTRVGNKICGRKWWEDRLKELINSPTVVIENNTDPGIYNQDGTPQIPPIPFEQEVNLDPELSQYWLSWLQQIFKNRYEHEAMAQKVAERIQRSRLQT
jgi:hypothetical protein